LKRSKSSNILTVAVNFHFISPAHPLAGFVERLWHLNDAPPHFQERIVPSGTMELVINLHEDELRIYDASRTDCCKRFSGAVVSGAYGKPFVIDTREHVSVMGVHFKPGGAFPFLGATASELADSHVDLESLWGTSAIELRERLCAAATPAARFRLLENALAAHLFRPLEHHPAVDFALDAFARAESSLTVREVAQQAGLSQRHFIQVFAREVGVAPKLFCRVRRFQQTLSLLGQTTSPNWAQLALDCGYFDQSHLIHDFRLFADLSPTEYARQRSERVMQNHVPLSG
jgi:AraC-like DNA-binding protein